jgi:hypothetical protein
MNPRDHLIVGPSDDADVLVFEAPAVESRVEPWPHRQEVINVTMPDEQPTPWQDDDELSVEELARRQGVKPIKTVDELAQPDLWESNEEYEAFLADLYASRRAGFACATSSSTPTSPRQSSSDSYPATSPTDSRTAARDHLRHRRRADPVDVPAPLGATAQSGLRAPSPAASSCRAASRPPPSGARSRPTPDCADDHDRSPTPGSPPAASSASCGSPRSTSRTTPTFAEREGLEIVLCGHFRGMSRGANYSAQEATRDTGREQKAQVGRHKASEITTSTGLRRRERSFESCRGHRV